MTCDTQPPHCVVCVSSFRPGAAGCPGFGTDSSAAVHAAVAAFEGPRNGHLLVCRPAAEVLLHCLGVRRAHAGCWLVLLALSLLLLWLGGLEVPCRLQRAHWHSRRQRGYTQWSAEQHDMPRIARCSHMLKMPVYRCVCAATLVSLSASTHSCKCAHRRLPVPQPGRLLACPPPLEG